LFLNSSAILSYILSRTVFFADMNYSTTIPFYSRFLMVLDSNTVVDESNNILGNQAPLSPSAITLPSTVYGGKSCLVSWSKSTDEDGDLKGYIVERSYDSGNSWTQIYKGTATNTSTSIPFGTKTVMFRVCAYDSYEAKSEYKVSANKNVV